MENPNIPELLVEVTAIEDLVESAEEDDNARALGKVARGFRNLATNPELYGVDNENSRHWITTLETELDRAMKPSRSSDTDVLGKLSVGLFAKEKISDENTQLSKSLELGENQMKAFPLSDTY